MLHARGLELRFPVGAQETLGGQLDGIAERIELLPDRVLLYADDGEAAAGGRPRARPRAGDGPRAAASLEDVFLRLTGRSLVD